MPFELTRTPDDRHRYALEDIGSLRLERRGASAEAGGTTWTFESRGVLRRGVRAIDAGGAAAGQFEAHGLRRGGTVTWGGRELRLRPASRWRERYSLLDGERELAMLEGKAWGRRPVTVELPDAAAVEPGLLLFAAYLVRRAASQQAVTAIG